MTVASNELHPRSAADKESNMDPLNRIVHIRSFLAIAERGELVLFIVKVLTCHTNVMKFSV